MEIEKEFVVRKSGASARAVLDDDETLCSLFPDTEIVSSEDGVRETLQIPDEVLIGTSIAIGRPERNFGPLARKPVAEVLHWDGWDPDLA